MDDGGVGVYLGSGCQTQPSSQHSSGIAQAACSGSVTLLLEARILGPLDSACWVLIRALALLGLAEGQPAPAREARLRM